jgi:amino acid transporter
VHIKIKMMLVSSENKMNSSIASNTHEDGRLKGNLGVFGVTLMVLAQAAPLTVMAGISPLMIGLGNGEGAPMTSIVVGVALLLFAFGFVAMARYIESAGAFYAYILKGMGRVFAMGAASVAVLCYTLLAVALEAYLAVVLRDAMTELFNITLHWSIYALALIALVGVLGYRNIEASAKILGVALILEIGIIVIADFAVIVSHGVEGMSLSPLQPSAFFSGNPGLGVLFAILGFIGFEATVVYREEAINPNKTIPIATYLSIILISVLYCASIYLAIIGVGLDKIVAISVSNPEHMYLDFINVYLGKVAYDIAKILLISSLFAATLSNHNIATRYKYILGRSGILTPLLASVHKKHCSPHVASAVQTTVSAVLILVAAVVGLDPVTGVYTWGAAAATLGYMVIVTLTALSVILFFAKIKHQLSTWSSKIAPNLAFVFLLAFMYLALSNLSALTGSEGFNIVNITIVGIVIIAFAVGSGRAIFMKLRSPVQFADILSQRN